MKNCPGLLDLIRNYADLRRGMSLDVLLNKCNFIKPRYFTIASSALMHPKELHIGISLEAYKLPDGKMFHGQTSHYCERLSNAEGP